MLFLVFEFEGGVDAAALVQESSPHVDLSDVADVEADEVQRRVEHDVGNQLLHQSLALHGVLQCQEWDTFKVLGCVESSTVASIKSINVGCGGQQSWLGSENSLVRFLLLLTFYGEPAVLKFIQGQGTHKMNRREKLSLSNQNMAKPFWEGTAA